MSYGVGHRRGSDPTLLWLWHKLVATAPNGPLAWEPPCDAGAAQEKAKKKKKKGVPVMALWLTNPTRKHEVSGSIPGLARWVNDPVLP